MINYQLTRCNRRKSIALQVVDGKVLIKAPSQVSINYIDTLITSKERWIKQKIQQQLVTARQANELCHHGRVWINGQAYKIIVSIGNKAAIEVDEGIVTCTIKASSKLSESQAIKVLLEDWFKQQAHAYLPKRTLQLSNLTGLIPSEVIVKKYRARWGSCDNFRRISLNYFLMMLPEWVIDYVIIHELCHLKHLNHSQQFWSLVSQHCQNFNQAKNWVKQHQGFLTWPKARS